MGWSPSLALLLLLALLAGQSKLADARQECYGSAGGANGHIYQFDGGHVSTFSRGCQFLLARSQLQLCHLELYATFGCAKSKHGHHSRHKLSQLRKLTAVINGKVYKLLSGRRLLKSGKPVNLPYSEHGIRAFYSGEDLVLVSKRCDFWVTFDGLFTGTFRFGSAYRGRLTGLAGNCNGIRHDDKFGKLIHAYKLWKRKGWIRDCRKETSVQKCHHGDERREAERACRKVINGRGSCSNTEVLEPCMIDYCSHRYRPDLQKKALCANFYLHSRRCARHHRPLAWRHKSGCLMKCGQHQHFSRKANPCPKTCDNHFFGTPRRCYKLPQAEGCRCNKGYVLDGSKCVKPKQCECLAKLCIDRVSHSKCRSWKAQGRCRSYPEVMGRFCRLTCGMCRPRCRNQISTLLCEKIKRQGKCQKKFYRVMCKVTCEPKKCGCPPKSTIKSKCSYKYKNKAVTTLRWYPDSRGRCRKSTLTRYYPCGSCRYMCKDTWNKCNFCKGVQTGKRLLQFRETHGKRRCVRTVLSARRKCYCPPIGKRKSISYIRCLRHILKVRITKTYTAVKHCTHCALVTKKRVLQKLRCGGTYQTGKCTRNRDYIIQKTYQRYAHNCRCLSRLVRSRKAMCRCNKPRSGTVCKGDHFLTETTSWKLKGGACWRQHHKTRRYIKCKRNYKSWNTCHRPTCKAYKHVSYFNLRGCKCKKNSQTSHLGKCCCPPGSRRTVRVDRYWKKLIIVTYVLIRYKCYKKVIVHKIRIACPKGHQSVKCDGRKGCRIFTKYWFVKQGNNCIKKTSTRRVNIKCRRDVKRVPGPCHILFGNVRYRRVEFHFYRRRAGSCVCERAKRTVKEMCGCRGGKYTRLTRCPRGCTSKNCGRQCTFSKEFYYYKVYGKSCRVHIFKQLHFRCCCRPERRVKNWCKDNHFQMQEVSYYVLRSHKCHRVFDSSSKRVRCLKKTETKKVRHPRAGYYYLATYQWYVSNCKCRVRITKRTCRKYCYKKSTIRFCDTAKRDQVTRYVTWNLHGCDRCVRHVRDRRVPVRCSHAIKVWKHCNKHSGVVTHYKQWWQQKGCLCLLRQSSKRLRCKCPKPVAGRSHCNLRLNAFEKKITYWVLSNGHCLKRSRTERSKVRCSSSVRTKTVCKSKTGVKIVYYGYMRPKNCKCVLVWSIHDKRHRCNCHRESKRVKKIVRPFCDKHRNLKGKERFYYVLVRGKCVKRSRKSYRSFRCPKAYREKRNCDEARHKQLVLKHYTVKRNCRCVRLVKRYHLKCGCYGKRVERQRYCKKVQGKIVNVLITRKWSNRKNVCVTRKRSTSHRVLCRIKTKYVNSKCIKNKYYIETKVYYVRKDCKCVRRELKKKRNCHCKRVIRRYKCPRNGYTRREVIEIRRWDMKRRRCKTKRYITRHIRCRCPKGYKRRYCKAGHWVTESVRFILRNARCYKKVVKHSQRVQCRRVLRDRFTSCHGCHRYHYTLEQRLQPSKCTCYFAVVKRRRCPCCCAKGSNKRYCARDDEWERVFTHHAPLTGRGCGCRNWVTRRRERVHCSSRKTYKWLRCNPRSCHSYQQVTYYEAKRCRCQKRERLTGKRRTCCCLTKPRFERFCKLSSIYEKRIFYQLHNWKCVRRTSNRLLRGWSCNQRPEIKIGRCDRVKCLQPVHTLVSVVVRPHCRCQRIIRNRYIRPCCCNKRPHHNVRCERNCWVKRATRYTYNSKRRVCVAHNSQTSSCVRCPRPDKIFAKCNRASCRQRITYVSYSLKNCGCKRREDYGYRVCCCPRPSTSGPVCKSNRYKVWYYTSWRLRHGRCERSVKETRKTVYCRKGVTRVLGCNRHTCRQRIKHETVRVNRCRCESSWRETQRTCCCRPSVYYNTRCEQNRFLYRYATTRTLNHHRKCVSHVRKQLIHAVHNCRTTEKWSSCNKLTRHATVYVYHRKIANCGCVLHRRSMRRVLCRCLNPSEKRGKCNKTTCHLNVVKVWFTSHGKNDQFRCQRHQRVTPLRCCCHNRPTYKTFCDRRSGAIKKLHTWTVFLAHSRTCVKRHSENVVTRLVCPRNSCHFGKCNTRTGYKVKFCAHFTKVNHLCRCQKHVTQKQYVCSCPKSHRRTFCQGNRKRITMETYWRLSIRENRCVRMVRRVTQHLVCPKSRWVTRTCKGCSGFKHNHYYFMHRCHCLRKTASHRVRCCCPKPSYKKRCIGDHWLLENIKYKLCDGVCTKTVRHKQQVVHCKRKITKRGKCKGCIRKYDSWYYHVRDCKCRLRKHTVRTGRCCCPKPRKFLQCKAGVLEKVCESWTLCNGKCLKKQHITSKIIPCPKHSIKRLSCNMAIRKQKIEIISYKREHCRCVKQRKVKHVLCKCRPSVKKAEKCDGRSKRRVFQIRFKLVLVNDELECKPIRHLLYWEPCRCRKLERKSFCAPDGEEIITVTKDWHLGKRHGRKECILKTSVSSEAVQCDGKRVNWTKCKNFRKTRITTIYEPVRCKCKRRISRKVFACKCSEKSYKRRYCDHKRGAIVILEKSFHSCCDATSCSSDSHTSYKSVRCSSFKHVTRLSPKCGIAKHHGWYTKYLLTWKARQGCKCVPKQRKVTKLCRCKRNSETTKCSRSGRYYVTVWYTYKRRGSVCHLTRTEKRRPVACRSNKAEIHYYGCAKCWRQVSLSQCYVRSCRIHHYRKSGLQRCCTPNVHKSHYCDARNGRWVWKTTTYRLVSSKPLLKDQNGRIVVSQKKVVSSTQYRYVSVRCPRRQLRENCNRRSGLWSKTELTWHRVGCGCVKKQKHWRGKCRCPSQQVRWSRCLNRYRVKTLTYFILKNRTCIRQVRRRTYLCACLKGSQFTVCDRRGHWKTCHISYQLQFRRQRCLKIQRCRRRPHTCPVHTETRGRCVHFSRVIKRYVWRLDKKRCKCVRSVYPRRADCDCHKRHHSQTVCKHGAYITTIFQYKQRGERCVQSIKRITKPVYCDGRHRSRIVRGSCVTAHGSKYRGYQKLLTEWKVNNKCRCERRHTIRWVPCICHLIKKYSTHKSVRCVRGSVKIYTTVYYKLVRGQCVRKVANIERKIHCVGSKTNNGKCKLNREGDKYSEIRRFHKVSDGRCGCVWKQRSLTYRICKCRKPGHSTRCLNNRVWRFEHISFHGVPGQRTCQRHVKRQDKTVYCKAPFSRRSACHRCGFVVRYYVYKHIHCKCVTQLLRVQPLKCCCPKHITKHSCDASRHLKVAVTTSYILRHHACHRKRTVRTQRVRCGRKTPEYRVFNCYKGFRKVTKTVHYAVACGCKAKVTQHKQRCSCPKVRIYQRGKCGRWFALDTWLAYKLQPTGKNIPGTNKPQMKCIKYVCHRQKRRCRCPKGYRKRICKSHNLEVFVTVTYHLRGNSCERKRIEHKNRLPCSTNSRLVRVETNPRKCSKNNGFIQVLKYIYVQAKNCKCVHSIKKRKRVCDCLRKYGQKKRTRCIGSNRLVTTNIWWVPKGDGCTRRSHDSVFVVHCKGGQEKRGNCERNGFRTYWLYQRRASRCSCVWQLVRRVAVPCRCRKSVVTKRCLSNHWVTVTENWRLVGKKLKIRCQLEKHVHKRRVPCAVGHHVERSRCNYQGIRYFTTTVRTLKNCRCLKRVTRRSCRCRCRKPTIKRYCSSGRIWVTVKAKSTLHKCVCYRDRSVSRQSVRCKKPQRTKGPCRRGRDGDKYRKLTSTKWLVRQCKCQRKHKVSHQLCGCDKRRQVKRKCEAGFIKVLKVTERKLVRGRCRRIQVVLQRERVRCGRVKVKRVCYKKSGVLSIFVTKPYVKKCHCFSKVTRHSRRCGCHHGSKLVSTGSCNKMSCRQKLLFKKQVLKDERCIWKSYHRHRVCCCKGYSRRVKCIYKRGYVVTTVSKRVLKHWQCVKVETKNSRRVTCKRNPTVRKQKLPRGVLKVVSCWVVRQGCICAKRCKTVFRRYKCKKPIQRIVCKCKNGRCHQHTYITLWRLSNGCCLRQTRCADKPIYCKPNTSSRTRCNKRTRYGFFYVETIVSWYQKSCKCYRRVRTRSVVCNCFKPEKRTYCERGRICTVNVSYRLSRGRCVKLVRRRSQAVKCKNAWRLSHRTSGSPIFYKVYERFVLSGCRCVRQTRREPCHSRCRSCTQTDKCEHGKNVVTVKTCWRLVGCRCVSYSRVTRKRVHCPRSSRRSHCHNCKRTEYTKEYSVYNCKCHVKAWSKKSKCCCPKPSSTKACIRGSVRTRRITHKLRNGRCYSNTHDSYRPVNCSRRVLKAIEGKCQHGKQKYSVHFWVKIGCRCVRRVRHEYRKCVCAHKAVELYLVVDLFGKDRRGYKERVANFLLTVCKYFQQTSAKVRTTLVSYNWSVHVQKLQHLKYLPLKAFTKSSTNLCAALGEVNRRLHARSQSGVEKIVVIITCGNHIKRRKTVELAEKIKRKASLFVVGFQPIPKSGRYVKWLASKPTKLHYMELGFYRKYRFSATRLFKRICKKACAKPVVRHSRCEKQNCRRVYTRITFHLDQRSKKCVRRSSSWWKLCCCVHRDSSHKECRKNRLFKVLITFRFRNYACHRRVQSHDISSQVYASCQPRRAVHYGPCRRDGWKKETTETRHVSGCRCRLTRRHRLIRCRCPKPHLRSVCIRGNSVQHCRYTYTLTPSACVTHRSCHTTRVICKRRQTFNGKCDRFSCKRSMGSVWYTVQNCRCVRHSQAWKVTCCCKRQFQKVRYCDKRRHEHVEVQSWLEFHRSSCRRVSRKIVRPVHCPGWRVERLKCIAKRDGYYQTKLEYNWKKRDCGCVKSTQSRQELCRCRRGYTVKQCRSGSWVFLHHFWQKDGNRCLHRTRVISRQRVTCSSKRHNKVGSCRHVRSDGRYAQVVQTWQRRVGCGCQTVGTTFFKLCACPKSYTRHSCHGNYRKVTTVYRYILRGNRCELRKFPSYKLIHCPKAYSKVSKCQGKTQAVTVVLHKVRRCKCISKVYKRFVQCKSKCRDLLPTGICKKWAASNKIHLCDKYPYFAKHLCALTCHRCYTCPKTRVVYAGNFCLSKQTKFRNDFILAKRSSFDICLRSCRHNRRCRAFDYDHSSRKCLLLRVNRNGLLLRFPSLRLRKTRDCILFERVCPTKCPFRRVLKRYRCKCIKFGKHRVCYRAAAVATWKRDRSGKCRRLVHKVEVPCRKCEDRRAFCKKSKCSKHLVRHLCNYTCGVCKRHPRRYHRRTRCSKSNWQKDIRADIYYDKKLYLWRVRVTISRQRCVQCPVGSYRLVGACKNGKRKLTKIVTRYVNNKCRISSHTTLASCKDCSLATKKLIYKCRLSGKRWIRKVVTQYTVRLHSHCVVRRSLAIFSCSPKCPRDQTSASPCKCGKRIRCVQYYITYPGSHVCVPKRYTASETCISKADCRDKIRPIDCLFVKKTKMCRSMRALCARTCGYCK